MGHWAQGEIWIPIEDWSEFVGKYAPGTDGEVSYGPPREEEGAICVPFAVNTECHPKDQDEPPTWLKPKEVAA